MPGRDTVLIGFSGALPRILCSAGRLPAFHPKHGPLIEPGRIYIAVPVDTAAPEEPDFAGAERT